MAIFKVPRASTTQRSQIIIEDAEIVFDTDQKRYYGGDGATYGGIPIASESMTESIILTQLDIDNKNIRLGKVPLTPSTISLTPSGGPRQIYGLDFEIIDSNLLSWDGKGLDSFLEDGDVLFIQY
jgi:hypothetical protein